MNMSATFKANAQPSKLMQPRQGSFYDPTINTQAAAVLDIAASNQRLDRPLAQSLSMSVRVVAAIRVKLLRSTAWSPAQASNWWNGVNHWQQLRNIVRIRPTQRSSERNALRICNNVVFRARFRPVSRVGAGFFAPPTARTAALSTAERDHSILSASWSRASKTSCNFCQTPARSHSFRRRQHVMPEPQPISLGKSSQGMPVLSTNKIPAKALRFSNGFRPGFFFRRGLTGISGSITAHNLSSTSGLVIPQA